MLVSRTDWPADRVLGAAVAALAPHRMQAAFAGEATLPASCRAAAQAGCQGIEALYDPAGHVRIVYALGDPAIEGARHWPQAEVVHVRYPVRPPMSRRGVALRLNGVEVEVYRLPNDRRLRNLRRFAQRSRAAGRWQAWLDADEPGLRLDPATLRRRLIRYVPEQKWIIRLDGCCDAAAGQAPVKRTVAVHHLPAQRCARITARIDALRQQARRCDAAFRIPRLVAADDGIMATRWAWGDDLVTLLRAGRAEPLLERIAVGLHAFHAWTLPDLQALTPHDALDQARSAINDLRAAMPDAAASLDALGGELAATVPTACATPRLIHNDFHLKQLRGRPQRLTLLDFDRCAWGDPLVDVANFHAQLDALPLRQDLDVTCDHDAVHAMQRTFERCWTRVAGPLGNTGPFSWYRAVAKLTLARGLLRHLRPGWRAVADHCVATARSAIAEVVEIRS